jgi:outer membrane protein assembly factor BamB
MVSARHILLLVLVLAPLTALVDAQRPSSDWTQWRGPNRDGAIAGFTAPAAWPKALTLRWKAEVGTGYATPLVVGNRVYMFSRLGDNETMTAMDADSGKVLWQQGYPAVFTMQSATVRHGPGPKSTPVVANGRIYSIGMTGIVTAWDAASGKTLWQKPGSTVVPMFTTHSFSPVIDGNNVIFHVGGHDKGALTAFDVTTGAERWSWPGDGPGYGSPMIATIGGTRQVIAITQAKMVGVDASNGTLLWEIPFVVTSTTNSLTPIVYGQSVIVGGNGRPIEAYAPARQGATWVATKLWENADATMRMSNGVIVRDMLISLSTRNMGQYFAIDAKTGKTLWLSEPRQAAQAAIQTAGDLLFSLEDDGELVISRVTPTAAAPVTRYDLSEGETWTQPVISGNRVFIKDVSSLALWSLN